MHFYKYSGLGNDFILVEGSAAHAMTGPLARLLCNRHFGIGADGVLVLLPSPHPDMTARMIIYNSDGSLAEMCGNGIRCLAYHAYRFGWSTSPNMEIITDAGVKNVHVAVKSAVEAQVTVDMGAITYAAENLPPVAENGYVEVELPDGEKVQIYPASAGNPHAIIILKEGAEAMEWAKKYGAFLEHSPIFPAKTNVEFVKPLAPNEYEVVVHERGCGITLACGTGATSVASLMMDRFGAPKEGLIIKLPGGQLSFRRLESGNMEMCGPARLVFSGEASC